MKKRQVVVALVAMLASGMAHSDELTGTFYAGLALGSSSYDLNTGSIDAALAEREVVGSTSSDDRDMGGKLFAGYAINDNLSVELSYLRLGEAETTSRISSPVTGDILNQIDARGLNIAIQGGFPLNEAFSLNVRIGLLKWDAEVDTHAMLSSGESSPSADQDGTSLSFGIGGEYRFNDQMSLRLDWDRYQLDDQLDADVDLVSLAAVWRF